MVTTLSFTDVGGSQRYVSNLMTLRQFFAVSELEQGKTITNLFALHTKNGSV